jgi:hypothetical protein
VKGFFNWTNTELVETLFPAYDDKEPGSARNDKKKKEQAFDIGARIAL